MNKTNRLTTKCLATILTTSILLSSCGSDGDSENLAKSVKLEAQRQNGTIIESFAISGGQTRLTAGDTHQLKAIGLDSKGETREVTNELTWSSSDETIASVNSKGLVTARVSSEVNQGIVIITGSTINEIENSTEISVSDVKASALTVKQVIPESGIITTCIDASISADVSYEDGYVSLNTTRGVSFNLNDTSTAMINNDGDLYTSSETTEQSIVTGKINDTITNTLKVTAEPTNLDTLAILTNEEETSLISLTIGDRLRVSAQATLVPEVSAEKFNIDNSITWETENTSLLGITETDELKGTLLALKPGVTQLIGSCGGKQVSTTIEVKGEADIEELLINDGEPDITIAPNSSIKLKLNANYKSATSNLNVSEFANWSINGSSIATAQLVSLGTENASYEVTSKGSPSGVIIVSATYDGMPTTVRLNIEQ